MGNEIEKLKVELPDSDLQQLVERISEEVIAVENPEEELEEVIEDEIMPIS